VSVPGGGRMLAWPGGGSAGLRRGARAPTTGRQAKSREVRLGRGFAMSLFLKTLARCALLHNSLALPGNSPFS
jgi:hypothetical protein